MLSRLHNYCRVSASVLIKIVLLCELITCPTVYCSSQIDGRDNGLMTTEKCYVLKPGVVINADVKDGSSLIDKMLEGALSLPTYSANYRMKVYKIKQTATEEGIFYFRKPKLLKLEVKAGSRKGSLAVLAQDGKIHGHLGGLMKYFSGSVSSDSDLAKAINDFPMAESDFYSLAVFLKNMLKQGYLSLTTVKALQTNKTNCPTYILDVYSSPKPVQLILHKRIYVDAKTYLPVFWEDYIDGKIWSESNWQNVKTNLKLPDNFFQP